VIVVPSSTEPVEDFEEEDFPPQAARAPATTRA
jgi:hypothetical protein